MQQPTNEGAGNITCRIDTIQINEGIVIREVIDQNKPDSCGMFNHGSHFDKEINALVGQATKSVFTPTLVFSPSIREERELEKKQWKAGYSLFHLFYSILF